MVDSGGSEKGQTLEGQVETWWNNRPQALQGLPAEATPRAGQLTRNTTEGREVVLDRDGRPVANVDVPFLLPGLEGALARRDVLDLLIDPRREIDRECGYPEGISPWLYHLLFRRDGVANRVVRIMPEESWAMDPAVLDSEAAPAAAGDSAFEGAWNEVLERLNLWSELEVFDVLSGIGRFGALLLGLDDGRDLAEPADGIGVDGQKEGTATNQLLYVRGFDETCVRVATRETEHTNPRFGQPILYQLIFKDLDITDLQGFPVASSGQTTKPVHWTRLVHFADGPLMSKIYGTPRMEPVFNRIVDVRKVLGGSAEMFWKGGFPGLSFELNPGVGVGQVDKDSLRRQVEAYSNGLQRYLALAGLTAKSLAPQIADPKEHIMIQLDAVALTLGIPKRVFYGSEEAKLASSQDAKTWNRRVARRQQKILTPKVVREFLDRLIKLGVLPEPRRSKYVVKWPDLNTVTDAERAEIALKRTLAFQAYVSGQVQTLIPDRPYLEIIHGLEEGEVDRVLKAQEEYFELEDGKVVEPPVDAPSIPGGAAWPIEERSSRSAAEASVVDPLETQ